MNTKGRQAVVLLVFLINLNPLAAIGADRGAPAKEGNIFDIPEESERTPPKFVVPGENKRIGGDKDFGKNDGIPNFMQVKNIPSLTQEQRKQIHNIYDQVKPEMNMMMKDMQTLRQERDAKSGPDVNRGAGGVPVGVNPAQRPQMADLNKMSQFKELREKIKAKRQETWQQVRAILNERNLQDLALMKKGQLLPADLRQAGAPPVEPGVETSLITVPEN